jgi:hypothetical protein
MKSVPFRELKVGDEFTYKDNNYVKANQIKISCCKFTNAYLVDNNKKKIGLKPQEMVEVQD